MLRLIDHLAKSKAVLRWSLLRFSAERTVLASSFGAEDVVLLDLFAELGFFPRVVTLDTGRLPQETFDVIDAFRRKYSLKVELVSPDPARVADVVGRHGPNLFYETVPLRRLCCQVRKTEPLSRALAGAQAWVTGLRREQSAERASVQLVEWDSAFRLIKLSPLVEWTEAQVWERIRERDVPYNKLHDAGYPSIGCAPCTRAVPAGGDPRSGRWWWESPGSGKECGLHPRRRDARISGHERPLDPASDHPADGHQGLHGQNLP